MLPKYRSAVVLDRSNLRTGFFIRIPPSDSHRSFRLSIVCGFGQHALNSAATRESPFFNGLLENYRLGTPVANAVRLSEDGNVKPEVVGVWIMSWRGGVVTERVYWAGTAWKHVPA